VRAAAASILILIMDGLLNEWKVDSVKDGPLSRGSKRFKSLKTKKCPDHRRAINGRANANCDTTG
jgi:hypothetical protein